MRPKEQYSNEPTPQVASVKSFPSDALVAIVPIASAVRVASAGGEGRQTLTTSTVLRVRGLETDLSPR